MSFTITAFNHSEWDRYGLADFSEFSEYIEFRNERETGYGDLEGIWFYAPDGPLPSGDRVIYYGTHGNDHSPGASPFTYGEVFDWGSEEDREAYRRRLSELEALPESIDDEEDSDDEWSDDESEESDDEHEHQWGPLETSRIAGTVHRKCQVSGCKAVLAMDDESTESDDT